MCAATLRICWSTILLASSHCTQEVAVAGTLARVYSHGGTLAIWVLCIIDAQDNNVEQIPLRSLDITETLLVGKRGSEAARIWMGEAIDHTPCVSCGKCYTGHVEDFFVTHGCF